MPARSSLHRGQADLGSSLACEDRAETEKGQVQMGMAGRRYLAGEDTRCRWQDLVVWCENVCGHIDQWTQRFDETSREAGGMASLR